MARFTKENLIIEGKYLTYASVGGTYKDRKFVARFRTAGVGSFATCLRKNFTVEEYFTRYDAGEGPLPIAQSKGYLLPHIKRWLKKDGYPVNTAGYNAWVKNRMEEIDAKYTVQIV